MVIDIEPPRSRSAIGDEIAFVPLAEIFRRYLSHCPLAYALFRAAECRAIGSAALRRPVLDLGCGVGEFAAFAVNGKIELGVDLSPARLATARNAAAHRALTRADAARLPIADESFASIVAVSACEHFARPADAVAEAYRVLEPGGRFVATIVLADLRGHLFYPRLLRRAGLRRLAPLYLRLHDRAFDHRALESRRWWETRLIEAGFSLVESRRIVAPDLAARFDFWLPTAWPYRFWRRFGKPRVWRPKWFRQWCWKMFQRLDLDDDEGAVLFVVAEKPG